MTQDTMTNTANELETEWFRAFPHLSATIKEGTFPVEPTDILHAWATLPDGPNKQQLVSVLQCFENKINELEATLGERDKEADENDADFERLRHEHKETKKDLELLTIKRRLDTETRARRTTTDPEKFTAANTDTAKRQTAYECWRTQINSTLLVDSICFPSELTKINYVTNQLGGKAWDAIQDGKEKMITNADDESKWTWANTTALLKDLDYRYILLDSTQSAKNALDTLYQGKRAYGDFKADFDHYATKAKIDNRTKVDLLRKRLSQPICNVLKFQVTLPAPDDYEEWSKTTDSIARNLQQDDHMANLRRNRDPRPLSTFSQRTPGVTATSTPTASDHDQGDPMDLSRTTTDSRNKISDSVRKYRTSRNLCMACGEPGHYSRDHRGPSGLPMPKKATAPPSTNTALTSRRFTPAPPSAPYQPIGQWQWIGPQFNKPQLRAIESGYITSESSSEADTETTNDTSSKGKGTPLA